MKTPIARCHVQDILAGHGGKVGKGETVTNGTCFLINGKTAVASGFRLLQSQKEALTLGVTATAKTERK